MDGKFTTVALKNNQYLKLYQYNSLESYMIGYTDNKRDASLDGYYINYELKTK